MKYGDIVELDKHFDPVFKLADGDTSAAWATFILREPSRTCCERS